MSALLTPPPRAVRRTRRRRSQRGAAVFVVVMAVTLLTAIGLFAAHSATLVDQAAGYARLARQTQHLAEYGTMLAAAELGSGAAEPYIQKMRERTLTCTANAGETAPCYKFFKNDLNARTKILTGENVLTDQSGTIPDVMGYHQGDPAKIGDVTSDFVIELTDPGNVGVPLAGSDLGGTGPGFRYLKVTATSVAQVLPAGYATCNNQIASLTGQQSMRAHLIVGPIQK